MSQSTWASRVIIPVALALFLGAIVVAVNYWQSGQHESSESALARWVDEAQCQQCHQAVFKKWQGSHHALAMQRPTPTTVRGNFNNKHFSTDTQDTTFFRKDGDYWIRTTDKGGKPHEYKVAYTFGWDPLQQYLLRIDNGRLQAYNIAWDTQKQKWFDLYVDEHIEAGDLLHWRQPAQNANFMCIDCHTSDFTRNYNAESDSFSSHWRALGVSCQSCHGPASNHVAWAQRKTDNNTVPNAGFEYPLTDRARSREVKTCARCHSRRTPLGDGFDPSLGLRDNYRVAGLAPNLYEVDGKILAEVFEYGAFAQSRMAQAGVVCSDCHDPHSGALRASGNAVCAQCHERSSKPIRSAINIENMPVGNFDSSSHHHHPEGSPGAQCVSCHMPGKVYMGIDLRHDHGFTSPNPIQARALGTRGACLGCHQDDDPGRIIEQFKHWYPDAFPRDRGFARAQFKARHGKPGAAAALFQQLARNDLPPLQRVALLTYLPSYPSDRARQAIVAALQSNAPAVRQAVVPLLPQILQTKVAATYLKQLLQDAVKSVRITAAWQLLRLTQPTGQPDWIAEYERVQMTLLSRATTHVNLANLYQLTAREAKVATQLHTALKLNPDFVPAVIMLAQWLEQTKGKVKQARALLEKSIARHPDEARLYQTLGLSLVRAGRYSSALQALKNAHRLAPDNANYAYVLAIALRDTSQAKEALQLLRRQVATNPADRASRLLLLHLLSRNSGNHQTEIRALLTALRRQNPWDPVLPPRPGQVENAG